MSRPLCKPPWTRTVTALPSLPIFARAFLLYLLLVSYLSFSGGVPAVISNFSGCRRDPLHEPCARMVFFLTPLPFRQPQPCMQARVLRVTFPLASRTFGFLRMKDSRAFFRVSAAPFFGYRLWTSGGSGEVVVTEPCGMQIVTLHPTAKPSILFPGHIFLCEVPDPPARAGRAPHVA